MNAKTLECKCERPASYFRRARNDNERLIPVIRVQGNYPLLGSIESDEFRVTPEVAECGYEGELGDCSNKLFTMAQSFGVKSG